MEPHDKPQGSVPSESERIAVFCVGNKLMLDDGLGPVVYEELTRSYRFPQNVELFDVGCMGLDMLDYVRDYDYMVTIDAIEGTDEPAGTVFEFQPDDMMRHSGATASLHELTLADLFDSAALLGYECDGKCFGMQVSNMAPDVITVALTRPVYDAVPLLVEAVLADLHGRGVEIIATSTGAPIQPGWHHEMTE